MIKSLPQILKNPKSGIFPRNIDRVIDTNSIISRIRPHEHMDSWWTVCHRSPYTRLLKFGNQAWMSRQDFLALANWIVQLGLS
jgi:hypothetical protein